ncbi:glucose/galactose transporter [Novosphingobium sp. ST904]|nr:glucose/galactose transporter [Novosphingobium sp. ST904]
MRSLVWLVFGLFFIWGGATSLNDVLIPKLKGLFALSYAEVMLTQFASSWPIFWSRSPQAMLVSRVGYVRGLVAGLALMAFGALLFWPASGSGSYWPFLEALFILASGITILQVASNPLITTLGDPAGASSRLTLAQAFNSLGTTIWPYIGAQMILGTAIPVDQAALSPSELAAHRAAETAIISQIYVAIAIVLILVALVFSSRRSQLTTEKPDKVGLLDTLSLLRQRRIAFGASALFIYVGAEVAIGSLLVSYLEQSDTFGLTAQSAGERLSLYWGGAIVGRFAGAWLLKRVVPGKLLAIAALCAGTLVLISMATSGPLAGWSIIAVGLFNSIMFPTIFSLAVEGQGNKTPEASGLLCMAIVGGASCRSSPEAWPTRSVSPPPSLSRSPVTRSSQRSADRPQSLWRLKMRSLFVPTGLGIGLLAAVPAFAQAGPAETADTTDRVQPAEPAVPAAASDAPQTLSGEWGGLRTRMRDEGVDLSASYVSETAWNASGGERERVRETGQFALGVTLDFEKLVGLAGGTFKATITYRRGKDLGAAAGLGVLQQVQEVYGRGQTWRLTQFWYQQSFLDGHADIKLGRLTQGEDFAAFSCQLQNLSFCGSPPGNLAGDYWYNWPISQWGARLRVRSDRFYAMAGAYEVNPRNLEKDFSIGHFHGATGMLVPIEVGYTPRRGRSGLPGAYRVGGWYNTADADDVARRIDPDQRPVTGLDPLRRDGRYGVYAQFQQQLTGAARERASGPQTTTGLVAFLNVTQADRRTTVTDNQVAAGLFYTGLIPGRPHDDIAFAVARANVNGRAVIGLVPGEPKPDAEYAAELSYTLRRFAGVTLRPNLQYVMVPGGYDAANDVVVVGLKASLAL